MADKTNYGWTLDGPYAHAQSLSMFEEDGRGDRYLIDILMESIEGDVIHYSKILDDMFVFIVNHNKVNTPYVVNVLDAGM